jgi:hypothetical protein
VYPLSNEYARFIYQKHYILISTYRHIFLYGDYINMFHRLLHCFSDFYYMFLASAVVLCSPVSPCYDKLDLTMVLLTCRAHGLVDADQGDVDIRYPHGTSTISRQYATPVVYRPGLLCRKPACNWILLYAAQTTHMHISAMSNTVYKKKNKSDNFRARMRELIPGRSLSIEIIVDILYSIDNSRYTVCH